MSQSATLALLCVGLLAAGKSPRDDSAKFAPSVPPWCAPDTGLAAQLMKVSVVRLVSAPDWIPPAGSIHVSAIPASNVKIITKETTCQRVSAALDKSFFNTAAKSQVLLVQAGTYYVAMPIGAHAGEFGILVILDSRYSYKATTTT